MTTNRYTSRQTFRNNELLEVLKNKTRGKYIDQNWHYIKLRKMNKIQSVFDEGPVKEVSGRGLKQSL